MPDRNGPAVDARPHGSGDAHAKNRYVSSPPDSISQVVPDLYERIAAGETSVDLVAELASKLAASGHQRPKGRIEADLASTGGPSRLSTLLVLLQLVAAGCRVPTVGVPGRPAGGIDVLATVPGHDPARQPSKPLWVAAGRHTLPRATRGSLTTAPHSDSVNQRDTKRFQRSPSRAWSQGSWRGVRIAGLEGASVHTSTWVDAGARPNRTCHPFVQQSRMAVAIGDFELCLSAASDGRLSELSGSRNDNDGTRIAAGAGPRLRRLVVVQARAA